MIIVGAGLSGLLAACVFPQCTIYEASGPIENHKALLRFRSDVVARLTGIDFRPVTVRKGVWVEESGRGYFTEPSVRWANLYAQKVTGAIVDRSIWDCAPVQRWIAPEDFYQQLVDRFSGRIIWNQPFAYDSLMLRWGSDDPVINTAPLPVVIERLQAQGETLNHELGFATKKIKVKRARIPGADVHQTVYFPQNHHGMYRASITGDLLIVELTEELVEGDWLSPLTQAFGFSTNDIPTEFEQVEQRYGKIHLEGSDTDRRALLAKLTNTYHLYSLGRFATWRNVLLDDVVQDLDRIKRLIKMNDYERRMEQ